MSNKKIKNTIVLAGGGTGGHLFVGTALAKTLIQQEPNIRPVFVGSAQGLEATAIPKLGYPLHLLPISGLLGVSRVRKLKTILLLPLAVLRAFCILLKEKPRAVIGIGGYASFPVVVAAFFLRIPRAICEQNAIPGLTNRLLSHIANRVFGSFEKSQQYFSHKNFQLSGNPVRPELNSFSDYRPKDPLQLLVLGGSLGARALNERVPEALALLKAKNIPFVVLHQSGKADSDKVRAAYAKHGIEAQVSSFIDNMAQAYGESSFAICRAGATTCTELLLTQTPSILVPYPSATHDHQTANAQALVEAGCAELLPQQEAEIAVLAKRLESLATNPKLRSNMIAACKNQPGNNSAEYIAAEALKGFRQ